MNRHSSVRAPAPKERRRPKAPPQLPSGLGTLYTILRRRPNKPNPRSAELNKASDAGSGAGTPPGTTSPDENVPDICVPADCPARVVRVSPTMTVKSISAFDPTWKSCTKVASPLLLLTVRKAFTSNCGEVVLSLMSGQVTVPLIMSESVVETKEKVSVPPDVIGKTPLVS